MAFNFRLMFSALRRSFLAPRSTHARLTPKRLLVIAIVFPLYIVIELCTWLCLLLDNLFFPACRRQEVREPLFIIGVQRSGTTFLHRVLDKDTANFSSMKMWEIFFAPSVIQKKFFLAFGAVDAFFGSPLKKLAVKIESSLFKGLEDFHRFSLFAAEEDEFILIHIFSSLLLIIVCPFADLFRPLADFDIALPDDRRAGIMAFYKRCVQNHLYVFGPEKRFLSKNPFFSGTVRSLNDVFPDAKFICMVRTPLETVPSAISLWSTCFHLLLSPLDPLPLVDAQREMITHYYRYPLEQLAALPPSRQRVLVYPDLVAEPSRIITDTYGHFGFPVTPAFLQTLQKEQEKSRRYESRHAYSLEKFGLNREEIVSQYADIFERFGFDRGA